MNLSQYFDHAATSVLDPRVYQEILPWLGLNVGNPDSIHSFGKSARDAVELARQRVATSIKAEDPYQITFVSGATEAATWLTAATNRPLVCSPFEHSCVRNAIAGLGGTVIPNEKYELFYDGFEPEYLPFVMQVNNETGAILVVPENAVCDITQAIGHMPVDVSNFEAAFFSSHKFGGPQGSGAVYLSNPDDWPGLIVGGGQENGRRSGTLNVAGIAGLGLACELAVQEQEQRYALALTNQSSFFDGLGKASCERILPNERHSPHIVSLLFPGIQSEILVLELDQAGYAVGSGSACGANSEEPSPILIALGYTPDEARTALRISFGSSNNAETSYQLGKKLATNYQKLLYI